MKILLVEDDRLLNHHLKSILQEESHQVYAAHQAEEALHFAEDYPIDVGIIDGIFVRGSAIVVGFVGGLLRKLQNGDMQAYVTVLVVGLATALLFAA